MGRVGPLYMSSLAYLCILAGREGENETKVMTMWKPVRPPGPSSEPADA